MDSFQQHVSNWTKALGYFSQYSNRQTQHIDQFLKSDIELHRIRFDTSLMKDADPRLMKLGCFEQEVIVEEFTSSAATQILQCPEKQRTSHQIVSNIFSLLCDILIKNPGLYGQEPSYIGLNSFEQNFFHVCHFMFVHNRLNLLENTQDAFSSNQLYPQFYQQTFEDILTQLHRLVGNNKIQEVLESFEASEITLKQGLDFILKTKVLWEHFKNVVFHLSNYEINSLFALTFERVEIYNTFGNEVKISLNKFTIKNETPSEKQLTDIQKFVQRSTEKLLDVPYKDTHPLVSFNKLLYYDYIDTEMKKQPQKGSDTILALIDKATTDGILNYRSLIAKRRKTLELQIKENVGKPKIQSQLQTQLIQNDLRIKQFEGQVCTLLFLMHRKNKDFYDRAVELVEIRLN